MGPIFTSLSSAIDPKLLSKKKNFSTTTQKKIFEMAQKSMYIILSLIAGCTASPIGKVRTRAFCLVLVTAFRKKNFSVNLSRER